MHEARLDATLRQLIEALRFLHGASVVHRDLKPSNVLVRNDGHVKVLDFGLAIEAVPWDAEPSSIAGTPAYMAPEQIWGQRCGAATDAYALGVMLFEIVAGHHPFVGDVGQIVRGHLELEAPRLDALYPGAPRRYADACERLLRKEPSARPALEELEVILELARTPRAASAGGHALLGREPIQRTLELRLHRTFAGSFAVASLMGPTGIGKTALLEWVAREAAREGGVVLRGRARMTEHIAFNALDGAIDGLAMVVRAGGGALAGEEALSIAGSVFPALGGPARAAATRMAAFAAVADLVRGVAAASQVTLIVDDVQWADADSLALLDEMVRRAPARTLIVAACRDDVGDAPGTAWARRHGGDVLAVAPLPAAAVRDLVLSRVREREPALTVSERALARVVAQCDGRPVLAELAARELAAGATIEAGDADLASALVTRVRGAPRAMRRLLGVLGAAERWTMEVLLRSVSGLSPAELTDALAQLQHHGLVVSAVAPRGDTMIDLAHDVVRTAVLEGLDADEVRTAHDAWADALALRGGSDKTALYRRVHHLVAAGRRDEAAPLAEDAARAAAGHGAFGLAAELYGLALRAPHADAGPLHCARAAALEDAGRHREAAEAWRAFHDTAGSAEDRLQAAVGEAQALLATSEVAAGFARLDAALAAAGEPSLRAVGLRGAVSFIAFLMGPHGQLRAHMAATPEEIERLERAVGTAQALMVSDPLAGLRLLQRARSGALRSGLAEIAAWCDYLCAGVARFQAYRAGSRRLADRYRERADLLLEGRCPCMVDVLVSRGLGEAWAALRESRCQASITITERELARLEQHGRSGSFAHLLLMAQRLSIDAMRTDISSHARQVARLREATRGSTSGGLAFHVALAMANEMLFRGEFAQAYASISSQLVSYPKWTVQRQLAHGT